MSYFLLRFHGILHSLSEIWNDLKDLSWDVWRDLTGSQWSGLSALWQGWLRREVSRFCQLPGIKYEWNTNISSQDMWKRWETYGNLINIWKINKSQQLRRPVCGHASARFLGSCRVPAHVCLLGAGAPGKDANTEREVPITMVTKWLLCSLQLDYFIHLLLDSMGS